MREIPGGDPVVSKLMTANRWDAASSFWLEQIPVGNVLQKLAHLLSATRLC
jgi:hypothetical protein